MLLIPFKKIMKILNKLISEKKKIQEINFSSLMIDD